MNEINERLARCFALVFPFASAEEIRTLKMESMPGWDSLKGVSLVSVIDEEFGAQIDLPDLLEMGSFEKVHQYLSERIKVS